MNEVDTLDRLSALAGIESSYHDIWGERRELSSDSKCLLLAAMGVAAATEAERMNSFRILSETAWRRICEPVMILPAEYGDGAVLPFNRPAALGDARISWLLTEEAGRQHRGCGWLEEFRPTGQRIIDGRPIERRLVALPRSLPLGYHQLELILEGASGLSRGTTTVIVAPSQCHLPETMEDGLGIWGFAVQLYALSGRRRWGMGDFGALNRLVDTAAGLGAGVIGLNPINALFTDNPAHASPYSPSSRRFLNPLYIDVPAVPDFAECQPARELVATPGFQRSLAALHHAPLVDYDAAAALKIPVLQLLYEAFRSNHLERGGPRAAAFERFQQDRGSALDAFAIFEALAEWLRGGRRGHASWQQWPLSYRDPASPDVIEFARRQRDRIGFFKYLQWEADRQVSVAAATAVDRGMPVGLYRDLALGADAHGADAWKQQHVLARGVTMGAPPDPFSLKGQNWGLPPFNPVAMREDGYRCFIDILRDNMRHAGALRIDHVLGLTRLFWIPEGATPADGGYVRYPLEDLLAITALESVRARCVVVGEDLGTVPEGLRDRLQAARVLSCRLLYFERDGDGLFRKPERYPKLSHVAIGSHDLPTFPGYWRGRDIELRASLNLFPTREAEENARQDRARARMALIATLREAGLWPLDRDQLAPLEMTRELVDAVYRFLAQTSGRLLMIHLEDLLGVEDQVNLPGTVDEHPNWRRKLPVDSEELAADPRIISMAQHLRALRPSRAGSQA